MLAEFLWRDEDGTYQVGFYENHVKYLTNRTAMEEHDVSPEKYVGYPTHIVVHGSPRTVEWMNTMDDALYKGCPVTVLEPDRERIEGVIAGRGHSATLIHVAYTVPMTEAQRLWLESPWHKERPTTGQQRIIVLHCFCHARKEESNAETPGHGPGPDPAD